MAGNAPIGVFVSNKARLGGVHGVGALIRGRGTLRPLGVSSRVLSIFSTEHNSRKQRFPERLNRLVTVTRIDGECFEENRFYLIAHSDTFGTRCWSNIGIENGAHHCLVIANDHRVTFNDLHQGER